MAEDWTKEWERRVVNGVYPLRRFLGRSNHSVVFLTECTAKGVAEAAIKILPVNPPLAEAQLAHWRRLETLSHPHLIRLLDSGRCQLGGHNFLFVVMDHAQQNLSQILPSRPLTPDEVRELLPATLDALAYLHGSNLAQGGLKPPNFLVVDDELKLASDTIRPAGERTANTARPSLYDPPEARKGTGSTPGDIWALGITLVEALTQTPPAWSRERTDDVELPANLAPEFVDTVRRCLNRDPGRRPTIAELVAQFKSASPVSSQSAASSASRTPPASPASPASSTSRASPASQAPQVSSASSASSASFASFATSASSATPASATSYPSQASPATPRDPPTDLNESAARTTFTQSSPKTRYTVTAIAVGVIALCAVWGVVHLFHKHGGVPTSAPMTPQAPAPVTPPPAATNPQASVAAPLSTVLHQENPDLSHSARQSIRGIIKIGVRVTVDPTGDVVAASLDHRVSSKYFARTVMDAAKKWKFSPATDQASRVWQLHFELTRAGTTAQAAAVPN